MSLIGYKGTDKDGKCRDFQYEVGKTYECDEAKLCESGFHFCLRPLDVLDYYPINCESRYFQIEVDDDEYAGVVGSIPMRYPIDQEHSLLGVGYSDSKCCTRKITIVKELTLDELFEAEVEYAKKFSKSRAYTHHIEQKNFISAMFGDKELAYLEGASSASIVGDCSASISESFSKAISGDRAVSISDKDSVAVSGEYGVSITKDNGLSVSNYCGNSASEEGGTSISHNRGTSISGNYGTSVSRMEGLAISKDYGISVVRDSSNAKSGDFGISVGRNSEVESGNYGISTSVGYIYNSSSTGEQGVSISRSIEPVAKGDIGAVLVLIKDNYVSDDPNDEDYEPGQKTLKIIHYKAIQIDGEKYKPNVWYTLDDNGEVIDRYTYMLEKYHNINLIPNKPIIGDVAINYISSISIQNGKIHLIPINDKNDKSLETKKEEDE